MSDYISQNSAENSYLNNETWVINTGKDIDILNKINKSGKKLSEWGFNINRGILTGYNDAFIIDGTTRSILIEQDSKCEQFIRPILRGRDIKRFSYDFADKYIIYIPFGFTNSNCKLNGEQTSFPTDFPSVYDYLNEKENEFQQKKGNRRSKGLKNRDDQGEYWWELRSCIYSDDFKQQNIAWQRITKKNIFCLTEKDMVILDSMAFISHLGDYKYYLLGILNSNVIYYWISLNVPAYGSTGYRLSNQFVVNMPIPKPNDEEFNNISDIVKHMIDNKCEATDSLLNQMIYNLYDLDKDEIIYIESQLKR